MRERVLGFCKQRGTVSRIDLEIFKDDIKANEGIVKGLLRIDREARQLAEEGILRRLTREEKILKGYNKKFAVYAYNGNGGEK